MAEIVNDQAFHRVFVDAESAAVIRCPRCKTSYPVSLPCDANMMIAMLEAFANRHGAGECAPAASPAEPPTP